MGNMEIGTLGSHMNPSKLDDLKTKHKRLITVSEKLVLDRVIISEIALEKQKGTFKNLIYFNKLMQVSMGGFNVNQKLLDLTKSIITQLHLLSAVVITCSLVPIKVH